MGIERWRASARTLKTDTQTDIGTIKSGGGNPRGTPRPFFVCRLASALDQARDSQQDHRTNDGIDDLGDETAADIESNARQ